MQKFTYKIILFIIFIEIVFAFYFWLYIQTELSIIFTFLSLLVLFIIIYIMFSYLSQKIINVDKMSILFNNKKLGEQICVISKFVIGIVFFLLIKDLISYIYAFIHETGHAVFLIFQGYEVTDIVINLYGTSYTQSPFLPITMDTAIIFLTGSIFSFSINFILIIFITLKHDIEIEIFLPLYGLIGNNLLNEIYYWIQGPFEVGSDAWQLLMRVRSINPVWLSNVSSFIMYIFVFLLIFLLIFKLMKFLIKSMDLPDLSIFLRDKN